MNPLNQIDFYKTGHIHQYPPGTSEVYANLTARSAKHAPVLKHRYDNKVVFFGLQALIQSHLIDDWNTHFFDIDEETAVFRYAHRLTHALGPGAGQRIDHIRALHRLGHLPIMIKALPEGSRVDIGVPLLTIRNTHPDFYWLTNYLETVISAELWKPITVATIAYEYRRLLLEYADRTGADPRFVDWQGHDFSFRGLSGLHDAMRTGAAHLLSFTGTDTVCAIDWLEQHYRAFASTEMIGGSVPATEHSVMSMGGQDDELGTFRRLITDTYPAGIVSIVSDTWDFFKVITTYAHELRDDILARAGKVVFRPDSGDPVRILCGYRNFEIVPLGNDRWHIPAENRTITDAERMGAVECLWQEFGGAVNAAGYKELDPHVGLIYGDSITLQRADAILDRLAMKGFASTNVVFGIGSYTYQHITRDSFGMAMKATSGVVNGERRAISKNPKTDDGTKKSAIGLLRVERTIDDQRYQLHQDQTPGQEAGGLLRPVFFDGTALNVENLHAIRQRLGGAGTARQE